MKVSFITSLGLLFAVACPPAGAVLGGNEKSIRSDVKKLHGSEIVTKSAQYTVHEITFSGGTEKMREYVSPSDRVFAITWSGYHHPDLKNLLGDYLSEFNEATHQIPKRKGVRERASVSPRLHFYSGGHMGALHGGIIETSLVPAGISGGNLP